jgi:2-dehydro-3-deoxygalactonokinase
MHFATIDCGTTNSRVYVLDQGLHIVNKGTQKVGVRDTAITGSKRTLREGLAALVATVLGEAGLRVEDIRCAITSGMITSEIGLREIPHLWAPAGVEELAAHVEPVRDPAIFPLDVEVVFIRGIKNPYPPDATYRHIRHIDFMRGEETQVVGLLARPGMFPPPFTAVVLSSHTKYIPVRSDGRIAGSITTLSGQLFEAICQGTSIGKSVEAPECQDADELDLDVVDTAYDAVVEAGFLRALLMPRFLDVLLHVPAPARRLFLEAAIGAEDLRALRDFSLIDFPTDTPFVLIGHTSRCRIFRYLLMRHWGVAREIRMITDPGEIDQLSIAGAVAIARRAGYLQEVEDAA